MYQNIKELRVALDQATEGGLYELQAVSKQRELDPHIWVVPAGEGWSRVLFWATDRETGHTAYFDSALTPLNKEREAKICLMESIREGKKQTAQIRAGLARLDLGLDPEFEKLDPTRN